jgi:hypothetical protein
MTRGWSIFNPDISSSFGLVRKGEVYQKYHPVISQNISEATKIHLLSDKVRNSNQQKKAVRYGKARPCQIQADDPAQRL